MERLYEGMFLLDANETSRSWSDIESHINHLFAKNEARLEYAERWSEMKLAFPVKGVTKGTYYLTYFRAPTSRVNSLRRDAEISERILRVLIVQEEWLEEEMVRRRDAAKQRAERGVAEAPPRTDAPAPWEGDADAGEEDEGERRERRSFEADDGDEAPGKYD
ncbi:MAG: 30S ribosomal protein S6 [Planctomycetes bacterium]|nr:30S ribosomal protein S6 [Planctomycetota bacterium]